MRLISSGDEQSFVFLLLSTIFAGEPGFLTSLTCIGADFFPWQAGNLIQRFGLEILLPYILLLTLAMLGFWLGLRERPTTKKRFSISGSAY